MPLYVEYVPADWRGPILIAAEVVGFLLLLSYCFPFRTIQHGCRMSQLPGVKTGDLVVFDDPLPGWWRPVGRLAQWGWRIYLTLRGYKVYGVKGAPWPHWTSWRERTTTPGGTRIHLRPSERR